VTNRKDILLIGGGGHCKSVIDVIEQENKFEIAGVIDQPEQIGKRVLEYEVIGSDNNLNELSQQFKYALITVGQIKSPNLRIKLFKLTKDTGFILPVIISPRAYVSKHSYIEDGTIYHHA
jgi:FlaA1/EpsC-like NDP-sugar epimerase